MRLNEFLNTCQNQWKNLFSRDENFKVELFGSNGHLKTLNANYCNDKDYLTIYKNMKVSYWEAREKTLFIIELDTYAND